MLRDVSIFGEQTILKETLRFSSQIMGQLTDSWAPCQLLLEGFHVLLRCHYVLKFFDSSRRKLPYFRELS